MNETGDHHAYTICHYGIFPNSVFNNNPTDIQLFQPIPMSVDHTKFICWELFYKPDEPDDPDYDEYNVRAAQHWDVLKGRRGRGPVRLRRARRHPTLDGLPAEHLQLPRVQADDVPPHHGRMLRGDNPLDEFKDKRPR